MQELGLSDSVAYRAYLDTHPDEWHHLDSLCRITISRFYRDRGAIDFLRSSIVPEIAERARASGESEVRAWIAGCASGEEPYTLRMIWNHFVSTMGGATPHLTIIATDADGRLLDRARAGCYQESSLTDLPPELAGAAFEEHEGIYRLRDALRKGIRFVEQDIRAGMPKGPFDLVFCRNLVFTYFDEKLQKKILEGIIKRLPPGGFLVIGIHESLPQESMHIMRLHHKPCIYSRIVPRSN
jgi:chemotaxis protein methyltransferase CheR